MTAEEKAKDLYGIFYSTIMPDIIENLRQMMAQSYAQACVEEIIQALVEYGSDNDELQNMDRELNWWNNVSAEIRKLPKPPK
jgi:hypothetical protein